jgi:hypothetical protein
MRPWSGAPQTMDAFRNLLLGSDTLGCAIGEWKTMRFCMRSGMASEMWFQIQCVVDRLGVHHVIGKVFVAATDSSAMFAEIVPAMPTSFVLIPLAQLRQVRTVHSCTHFNCQQDPDQTEGRPMLKHNGERFILNSFHIHQ